MADPQPHDGASLTPRSRATSHPESRTAPHQLILPGVRTGDSGTKKWAQTAAVTEMIRGNQNSQW